MKTLETTRKQIWHRDFNLSGIDNLDELPEQEAIFGLFAMIDDEPVNCRFIDQTDNLRQTVKALFEKSENEGLRSFMQGAWIKTIMFIPRPDSPQAIKELLQEWGNNYEPKVDDSGEYTGYYD